MKNIALTKRTARHDMKQSRACPKPRTFPFGGRFQRTQYTMLEYGDVFSTTAATPSSNIWTQERTVLGTRVLGFSCGPNSAAAAVVTEGVRLAAPGLGAAKVERLRLDRDVVRWLRGHSVWAAFALPTQLLLRNVDDIVVLAVLMLPGVNWGRKRLGNRFQGY